MLQRMSMAASRGRKRNSWITPNMGFVVAGASQDTGSGLNFDRNGLA
jgi:hypothetical protein